MTVASTSAGWAGPLDRIMFHPALAGVYLLDVQTQVLTDETWGGNLQREDRETQASGV